MAEDPWFSKAFGAFYTEVYSHRNEKEAKAHLPSIIELAQLKQQQLNILDLGCGQGRYSQLLKELGHRVIGLDYSSELLKLAHSDYPQLSLCRGNMLQLPFQNYFDRVLSLFTSFGYFKQDHENLSVLQQMHQSLKPNGLLYLDFLNANLVSESDWEEKQLGSFLQKSKKQILTEQNRVEKEIYLFQNDQLKYHYFEYVKLYNLEWFNAHLSKLGFELINTFGNYSGDAFDSSQSPRLILLLKKLALT